MSNDSRRPQLRKLAKQARSLVTIEVIVEAAARILEERGSHGFSTNAVAKRAGVSIGSLYQYFPRKEALLWALIARETSCLIDETGAARAESTGISALSVFILAAVRHQFRRPALALLLDQEEQRLPSDPDTQVVIERLQTTLREILLLPDIPRQPDGKAAADDVMTIIKGLVDAAGARGDPDERSVASRVARTVLGYLGVTQSNPTCTAGPEDNVK